MIVLIAWLTHWLMPTLPMYVDEAIQRQLYLEKTIKTEHDSDLLWFRNLPDRYLIDWKNWNIQQTYDFISNVSNKRFRKYSHLFLENKIDGQILTDINGNKLYDMGIADSFHRKWILESLALLVKMADRRRASVLFSICVLGTILFLCVFFCIFLYYFFLHFWFFGLWHLICVCEIMHF